MMPEITIRGLTRPVTGGVRLVATDRLSIAPALALRGACTHEVTGPGRDGFLAIVAAQTRGPVIWVGPAGDMRALNPIGLSQFLKPDRIVTVGGLTRLEVLWSGEQALRTRGAGCVVIELAQGPDLSESRRLQLAAEEGQALGLISLSGRARTSSAQTRWHCENTAPHRWRWDMVKNRAGQTGTWFVDWKCAVRSN